MYSSSSSAPGLGGQVRLGRLHVFQGRQVVRLDLRLVDEQVLQRTDHLRDQMLPLAQGL
jgi:hypothetical protein